MDKYLYFNTRYLDSNGNPRILLVNETRKWYFDKDPYFLADNPYFTKHRKTVELARDLKNIKNYYQSLGFREATRDQWKRASEASYRYNF